MEEKVDGRQSEGKRQSEWKRQNEWKRQSEQSIKNLSLIKKKYSGYSRVHSNLLIAVDTQFLTTHCA